MAATGRLHYYVIISIGVMLNWPCIMHLEEVSGRLHNVGTCNVNNKENQCFNYVELIQAL